MKPEQQSRLTGWLSQRVLVLLKCPLGSKGPVACAVVVMSVLAMSCAPSDPIPPIYVARTSGHLEAAVRCQQTWIRSVDVRANIGETGGAVVWSAKLSSPSDLGSRQIELFTQAIDGYEVVSSPPLDLPTKGRLYLLTINGAAPDSGQITFRYGELLDGEVDYGSGPVSQHEYAKLPGSSFACG